MRVMKKYKDYKDIQVGFVAVNKVGQIGAYSIQPGFNFAVKTATDSLVKDADFAVK